MRFDSLLQLHAKLAKVAWLSRNAADTLCGRRRDQIESRWCGTVCRRMLVPFGATHIFFLPRRLLRACGWRGRGGGGRGPGGGALGGRWQPTIG